MIVTLAVEAGLRGSSVVPFSTAVLAGQLSIGWSNDVFDATRDAAAKRLDKPIVLGTISRRAVTVAAAAALTVCIVLCYAFNAVTGTLNLVMMAAGWAYNAGLKSTATSAIMYFVGFGLIPAFASSAGLNHPTAPAWTIVAAGMLGLGAHFANVLPDLDGDKATGVRGTPQRIAATRCGPKAVRLMALAFLLAASGLIVLAPGPPYRWPAMAGLAAAGTLAVGGALAPGRLPFQAALGIAGLNVVLFVSAGIPLAN